MGAIYQREGGRRDARVTHVGNEHAGMHELFLELRLPLGKGALSGGERRRAVIIGRLLRAEMRLGGGRELAKVAADALRRRRRGALLACEPVGHARVEC